MQVQIEQATEIVSYPPEVITIVITEEDRRNAASYNNIHDCILCTAVKRLYPKERYVSAGGMSDYGTLRMSGRYYEPLYRPLIDPFAKAWREGQYDPSIVGTEHTFIRVR